MFTQNMEVCHRTGIQYTLVPLDTNKHAIATISVNGSFTCPECNVEWRSNEIIAKIIYYPSEHAFNAKAYRQACKCGILVNPKLDDAYIGCVESKLNDLSGYHRSTDKDVPRRLRTNAFYDDTDDNYDIYEPPPLKKGYCILS